MSAIAWAMVWLACNVVYGVWVMANSEELDGGVGTVDEKYDVHDPWVVLKRRMLAPQGSGFFHWFLGFSLFFFVFFLVAIPFWLLHMWPTLRAHRLRVRQREEARHQG